MEKTEALQIIKQVIDLTLQAGLLKTLEDTQKVAEAYSELLKEDKK